MTAAEIVEAGQAAGHDLTAMFVHNIRSRAKAKANSSGGSSTTAKKKAAKGTGRVLSIAKRAAEARAKLARKVAAAPEADLPVKRGPGRPRKEQAAAAAPVKRGPGRHRNDDGDSGPLAISGSLEQQFAAIAVELGISRAESILRRVRDVLAKLTF